MDRTKRLVALAAAALLAGCGTTAPLSQQRQLSPGGSSGASQSAGLGSANDAGGAGAAGTGLGTGGSAGGATDGGLGATGGTAGGSAVANGGGATATGSAPGQGPTGGNVASDTQAGDGPGVTATTINVGGYYDPNLGAADSALGASGQSPGNYKDETDAVVAYINSHGGVAHRKINMIWQQVNAETDSSTQIQQQTCADWTQDNKTFIFDAGLPIWDQCAANEGAVGLQSGYLIAETTPILQHYPMDIGLADFTIDHGDRLTIEGLARQGYFSSGAKVGIATWDESDYQYGVTAGVDPALAAIGIHNVPVEYITVPQSYSDLGATSSSVAAAVLKFRSMGIDHVILLDGGAGINSAGILVLEWMNQANSQRYYPKYGLNSTSGFSSLAPDYPQQEMVGSLGVGWSPSIDLSSADYEALPQNAQQKECLQIMSAAGQAPSTSNQEGIELGFCDEFFFLQFAFRNITGPLNQQTALAAIDSVGSSFADLTTFGTFYSASRHDGAQLVRNVSFYPSCTCYRYTSGAYNPG
jgi:hypothetical protein